MAEVTEYDEQWDLEASPPSPHGRITAAFSGGGVARWRQRMQSTSTGSPLGSETGQSTSSVSSAPQRPWTLLEVQRLLFLITVYGTHNWPAVASHLSCLEGAFAQWQTLNVVSKWDSLVNWTVNGFDMDSAEWLLGSENNAICAMMARVLKDLIKLNGIREPGLYGLTRSEDHALHRMLDAILCFGFDWTKIARHMGLETPRKEILVRRKWQWLVDVARGQALRRAGRLVPFEFCMQFNFVIARRVRDISTRFQSTPGHPNSHSPRPSTSPTANLRQGFRDLLSSSDAQGSAGPRAPTADPAPGISMLLLASTQQLSSPSQTSTPHRGYPATAQQLQRGLESCAQPVAVYSPAGQQSAGTTTTSLEQTVRRGQPAPLAIPPLTTPADSRRPASTGGRWFLAEADRDFPSKRRRSL